MDDDSFDSRRDGPLRKGSPYSLNTGPKQRVSVGDITGSTGIAIGRGISGTVTTGRGQYFSVGGDQIFISYPRLFLPIYQFIESRPEIPDVDKRLLFDLVSNVDSELAKRGDANAADLGRWLILLEHKDKEVYSQVHGVLTNPELSLSPAVRQLVRSLTSVEAGSPGQSELDELISVVEKADPPQALGTQAHDALAQLASELVVGDDQDPRKVQALLSPLRTLLTDKQKQVLLTILLDSGVSMTVKIIARNKLT